MVTPEPEKNKDDLNLEEGSVKMTLKDIYVLFYVLVRQNQEQAKKLGQRSPSMSFDLRVFGTLPKKIRISFERKHGRLFAWIPEKHKRKKVEKSKLFLPDNRIIKPSPN